MDEQPSEKYLPPWALAVSLESRITDGTSLHSRATISMDNSQHLAPPITEVGDAAHACLRTIKLYQHTHEKTGPQTFLGPDSIFPDKLVEILMELDTSESYEYLRHEYFRRKYRQYDSEYVKSLHRMRRIKKNRAMSALQKALGQKLQADALQVALGESSRITNAEEL